MFVTTYDEYAGNVAAERLDASPFHELLPGMGCSVIDPLGDDLVDDDIVLTTKRAVSRVALVAAETAARFQREGRLHDPMAWMLAPTAIFGGVSPLGACLGRDACLRGILLHRLSLSLEVDPALLEDLVSDVGDDEIDPGGPEIRESAPGSTREDDGDGSPSFSRVDGDRLYTATIVTDARSYRLHAFLAGMAPDAFRFEMRLRERLGEAASGAVVVEGFDASDPLVDALVSPAVADMLMQVAAEPRSSLATGLDLLVEQRFAT